MAGSSSNDLRTLLMMSMALTGFGFLILYMSITSHQQAVIDQSQKAVQTELKALSSAMHSRSRNQQEDLGLKQDHILEKITSILQKTMEVTQQSAKLHDKVDKIDATHKDVHKNFIAAQEQLASRFEAHHNAQEDITEQLRAHQDEHQVHLKEHQDKPKATTAHWDFPNGATLTSPWQVNDSTIVSMEERRLFNLDKEGYIRFKTGVKRIHIYVGSALVREYAATFASELKSDDELHIFAFGPEVEDEVSLPKQRFTLIPAGVFRVTGYHTAKSHHYPVVRLENLLQLIPTEIPVELVKMGPHYDFFALLSAGAHLQDITRLVLRLQDIPNEHTSKVGKAANTTATTTKLQQKGLHRLCCNCVDATNYWLDCFFARKDYANITKSWDSHWLRPLPIYDQACAKYVDKETGDAIEAKTGKAEPWSTYICKKR